MCVVCAAGGVVCRGEGAAGASFESPEGGKVIEHALELLVVESLGQRRDERLGLLGRLRAQVAERGDLELLQLLLREQAGGGGGGDESDNGTDLARTGRVQAAGRGYLRTSFTAALVL